ncbi:MAG: hypothetical protein KAS04_04645 [Candidatus Aenigmarchaeota archaeon]|nr:hypothetical protein [Candidatus Aenigmarchaeota archaeon]
MTIGIIEKANRNFHTEGIKLSCCDCLYGHSKNCPLGVMKLCREYLGWASHPLTTRNFNELKKIKEIWDETYIFEIINDPKYYKEYTEKDGDDYFRKFFYCELCKDYIPHEKLMQYKHHYTLYGIIYNKWYNKKEIELIKNSQEYKEFNEEEDRLFEENIYRSH